MIMTLEHTIAILKADTWVLTRDQSHAMAQAIESGLAKKHERAEKALDLAWRLYHELSSGLAKTPEQFDKKMASRTEGAGQWMIRYTNGQCKEIEQDGKSEDA